MKKRIHLYVSRKNVLTWLMAACMVSSAVARIWIIGVKGTGGPVNVWSQIVLPVDSLRNKAWVEANGHTPSIMDYARFNYVAQPEDSISRKGIFPRIGPYDRWAIQWGYTLTPNAYDEESDDWRIAVEEGSNMVRIGTRIFGERAY